MKLLRPKVIFLILLFPLIFILSVVTASAYSNSGYSWSGTSLSYYVQSAFASSFRTAMQTSDATWDAAGSTFRFSYAGTTSRNPNVWSSGYSLDGYNDIGYYNNGATGTVASASGGLSGTTITERDMTLNTYYGFTTVGASGKYDVQNTITHELGHWLKLLDVSSAAYPTWCGLGIEATMCGSLSGTGETRKRSLTSDDKNGIKAIYGT